LNVARALPPGTYTLVLFLEKVRWRVVGDAEHMVGPHGQDRARALVAHYAVP
jgi:hypothetical protein